MSIHVENNLKNTQDEDLFKQPSHYLPCKIEFDGQANVDSYFKPYISQSEDELTASFRGYPLDGKRMGLPSGHTAVVVTEAKRPLGEDTERRFQVMGGFKDFTYWNWDKKPSKNDNFVKAMDWIDIADAIHGD